MPTKPHLVLLTLLIVSAASWTSAQDSPIEKAPAAVAGEAASPVGTATRDDTLQLFDHWAAQQEIYSLPMIANMRERLRDRLAALSPDRAAELRDQTLQKLKVFDEPLAQDAKDWMLQTLAVASDSYAATVRERLPDIVDDSPDLMRTKFRALALRRVDMLRYRAGFEQNRAAAVSSVQEDTRRQAAANSQVRAGKTYSSPNLYTPGANRVDASARYQGYFNQRYANPFAFGGVWVF